MDPLGNHVAYVFLMVVEGELLALGLHESVQLLPTDIGPQR